MTQIRYTRPQRGLSWVNVPAGSSKYDPVLPVAARIEQDRLFIELEVGGGAAGVDVDVDAQAAAEMAAHRVL